MSRVSGAVRWAVLTAGAIVATVATAATHAAASAQGEPDSESGEARPPVAVPPSRSNARGNARALASATTRDGMVKIPGATFNVGTADAKAPPNERPPVAVVIAPYAIDRTEITVAAYRACVERHACERPTRTSRSCTYDLGDPELPVTCVSWSRASTFCRAEGKRLPTEAEWEYAARGPRGAVYPWGGTTTSCGLAATLVLDVTARSCAGGRPSRVGEHLAGASVFGVLDMCGNAEEWTADPYAEARTISGPPASGASHALRGGGWLSPPSLSRTTSRNWGSLAEAGPNVGFRCARDARD